MCILTDEDNIIETQESKDSMAHEVDTSICYICKKETPPAKTQTKKGKGKGKRKSKGNDEIKWLGCDECERWFHCVCLVFERPSSDGHFKCGMC